MFFSKNPNKDNIFREGIVVSLFFVSFGVFLIVLNIFFPSVLLIAFSIVFFALAAVVIFMLILIPATEIRGSEIILYLWNEFLFTFVGIPLAAICILILPASIYLLFFSSNTQQVIIFSLIFTFSLQFTSLIYTGVKLWLSTKKSGNKVPSKVDKGPIEQLLNRFPSMDD